MRRQLASRTRWLRLPADSPGDHPDEHIRAWVRAEVTANTGFGTAATVRDAVGALSTELIERADDVTRRCRTALPAEPAALLADRSPLVCATMHVVPVREAG